MEITIYRRHPKDCAQAQDRYAPRCGCNLWFQFNWQRDATVFNGNKLGQGQNKWAAGTRIWAEAQQNARKLEKDLEDLLQGKQTSNGTTVEKAVAEWLQFREANRLTNTKPKLMGDKLVKWCEQNGVLMLSAFTAACAVKFRMSLPFRTGDSSSLAVHWSVISGFFNWAVGVNYIPANPIPSSRQHPQFRIKYVKPEVVPPTRRQVDRVLAMADGSVKVLLSLMRETGMAGLGGAGLPWSSSPVGKTQIPGPFSGDGFSYGRRPNWLRAEASRLGGERPGRDAHGGIDTCVDTHAEDGKVRAAGVRNSQPD